MGWLRVDSKLKMHPRAMRAGVGALGFWLVAGCWVSESKTDGFIPEHVLPTLPGYKARYVARLIDSGMWEKTEGGGVRIVDWHGLICPFREGEWNTAAYSYVYQRDGHTCRYCGATAGLSIDHIKPRIQGGGDDAENLVVCCRSCNSRKGGRTPEQAGMVLRPQGVN